MVPKGADFLSRIRSYYLQVDSSPDFFVRAIPARFRRENRLFGAGFADKVYLADLDWTLQFKYILSKLYGRMSKYFLTRLRSELRSGNLNHVRQWFYTANGVVFPYLIEGQEDYDVVDRLTHYALEGCAQNYSLFMSSLKKTKKLLRKAAATSNLRGSEPLKIPFTGTTRLHWYYTVVARQCILTPVSRRERMSSVLLWTQSRATGLCDASMMEASLEKFRRTVTEGCEPLDVDIGILQSTINCDNVTGMEAQVSCGPKACLQSPQAASQLEDSFYLPGSPRDEVGGQTRYLLYLATHRVVRWEYTLDTLEPSEVKPRPCSSPYWLLQWAIHAMLSDPVRVRSVRYHCVADQSKARSITVAHYAYQVVMGVFAHLFSRSVVHRETKSGLSSDRHLWNFLHNDLSPGSDSWEYFSGQAMAFSTDLSEATDFGNWWFARAVWSELLRQTLGPRQPTGLILLAKKFYTSPRPVFYRVSGEGKYDVFLTQRGFLMGDLMTKVILTVGQDYNARLALLRSPIGLLEPNRRIPRGETARPYNLSTIARGSRVPRIPIRGAAYSLVGDDIIILYSVTVMMRFIEERMMSIGDVYGLGSISPYMNLEPWFIAAAESGGWKVSIEDTFDSSSLMFYAEEGSMVPQGPSDSTRQSIWRGRTVGYLDYPRIRLLLPVKVETSVYSKTNVGRFSLLGKEARWVLDTASPRAVEKFEVASVLQHLVVPRDIETLCPYVPQEIGGDGSYTSDPEFFSQVIHLKSSDEAEVLFRMKEQVSNLWSHRFVASDKVRSGVQKQHLILPTLERMKAFLPERSILTPPSEEHRVLMDAVPRNIFESPMTTFTKIVKKVYYTYLFKGKVLPSLRVRADVSSRRGSTPVSVLRTWFEERDRFASYLSQWRRPGFRFYDKEPFYVVPYRHKDVMSLGWTWKVRPEPAPNESRLGVDEFIDVILKGKDIPLIMNRLQYLFETDPLLEIRVRERPEVRGNIGLVSWDKKLASRIVSYVRRNRDPGAVVYLIHPAIYFLGRAEEVPPVDYWMEDAGAIGYFGRSAAASNLEEIVCNSINANAEVRYPGVVSFRVEGTREAPRAQRVRADGPDEGYIEELRFQGARHPELVPNWDTDYLPAYVREASIAA